MEFVFEVCSPIPMHSCVILYQDKPENSAAVIGLLRACASASAGTWERKGQEGCSHGSGRYTD